MYRILFIPLFLSNPTFSEELAGKYPSFPYPANAEQIISASPSGKVFIFAYGSLLNRESALRSLSEKTFDSAQPVIAEKLKRVFDRDVIPGQSYQPLPRKNDRAMLNVYVTDSKYDIVNGVVFEVGLDDLKSLIKREEGYDLIPILVRPWTKDPIQQRHCRVAYTFAVPREKKYVNKGINPVPGYYWLSKEGAGRFGAEFQKLWLETTFLADEVTKVTEWEANPRINCKIDRTKGVEVILCK